MIGVPDLLAEEITSARAKDPLVLLSKRGISVLDASLAAQMIDSPPRPFYDRVL